MSFYESYSYDFSYAALKMGLLQNLYEVTLAIRQAHNISG